MKKILYMEIDESAACLACPFKFQAPEVNVCLRIFNPSDYQMRNSPPIIRVIGNGFPEWCPLTNKASDGSDSTDQPEIRRIRM